MNRQSLFKMEHKTYLQHKQSLHFYSLCIRVGGQSSKALPRHIILPLTLYCVLIIVEMAVVQEKQKSRIWWECKLLPLDCRSSTLTKYSNQINFRLLTGMTPVTSQLTITHSGFTQLYMRIVHNEY